MSASSRHDAPASHLLVPASTAVPTAATKQQNEKHNDEKRGGIHMRFPRNAAYYAAWNSDFLTTFSRSSGSRYPARPTRAQKNYRRNGTALTSASQSVRHSPIFRRNARQ
jgi:hypothetical protein